MRLSLRFVLLLIPALAILSFANLALINWVQSGNLSLSSDRLPLDEALIISFWFLFTTTLLSVLIYRWSLSHPMEQISQICHKILRKSPLGEATRALAKYRGTEFGRLTQNLEKVFNQLELVRQTEATDRHQPWTEQRLKKEIVAHFGEEPIAVIANREPYLHVRTDHGVEIRTTASGLVTALEPIISACNGIWIGHGSGSADKESCGADAMLEVPPGDHPKYSLKRVWLTPEEDRGYYYGFANEGLWPLFHTVHTRPVFRNEDWIAYQSANRKFAGAFFEARKEADAVALVQDYHFALLPKLIRENRPKTTIGMFWHIPWTSPGVMRICPWTKELIAGMLASDLIGFQTQYYCNNFLACADAFLEARVDREHFSVTYGGHTCFVKPFPISVAWPPRFDVPPGQIPEIRSRVFSDLGIPPHSILGLGVDRIDYTKGILERLLSIERLLEMHPELIGSFVFLQIGEPSRTRIAEYQNLATEIQALAIRINMRFKKGNYHPILLKDFHHDAKDVYSFYRAADVCVVNSLHDGMNLVAKEFVASRSDNGGALVLSRFTGAAEELPEAYLINPYYIEETAQAIWSGIDGISEENRNRMIQMRAHVEGNNVYRWAGLFLIELAKATKARPVSEPVVPFKAA